MRKRALYGWSRIYVTNFFITDYIWQSRILPYWMKDYSCAQTGVKLCCKHLPNIGIYYTNLILCYYFDGKSIKILFAFVFDKTTENGKYSIKYYSHTINKLAWNKPQSLAICISSRVKHAHKYKYKHKQTYAAHQPPSAHSHKFKTST